MLFPALSFRSVFAQFQGPLRYSWLFFFERHNGVIQTMVHGTKDPEHQIAFSSQLLFSLSWLKEMFPEEFRSNISDLFGAPVVGTVFSSWIIVIHSYSLDEKLVRGIREELFGKSDRFNLRKHQRKALRDFAKSEYGVKLKRGALEVQRFRKMKYGKTVFLSKLAGYEPFY
jgi:hypothetical protein